jgi:hypothetical protein
MVSFLLAWILSALAHTPWCCIAVCILIAESFGNSQKLSQGKLLEPAKATEGCPSTQAPVVVTPEGSVPQPFPVSLLHLHPRLSLSGTAAKNRETTCHDKHAEFEARSYNLLKAWVWATFLAPGSLFAFAVRWHQCLLSLGFCEG